MTIDEQIAAMTYTERMDVAECACDGCKGQWMLKHDSDCYTHCDTFKAAVAEANSNEVQA